MFTITVTFTVTRRLLCKYVFTGPVHIRRNVLVAVRRRRLYSVADDRLYRGRLGEVRRRPPAAVDGATPFGWRSGAIQPHVDAVPCQSAAPWIRLGCSGRRLHRTAEAEQRSLGLDAGPGIRLAAQKPTGRRCRRVKRKAREDHALRKVKLRWGGTWFKSAWSSVLTFKIINDNIEQSATHKYKRSLRAL